MEMKIELDRETIMILGKIRDEKGLVSDNAAINFLIGMYFFDKAKREVEN